MRTDTDLSTEQAMDAGQWLTVAMLSVLWGASYLFHGMALPEVPLLTIVLARVGIAAVILTPVVYLMGHRLPSTLAGWRPFVVVSLSNNLIPFSLIVFGQREIASGLAAVLNATTPIWVLAIGHFSAGGPKLVPRKALGVAVGIVGVAVLVGPEALFGRASSVFAMVCVLLAAVSYGFGGIWGRRFSATPPIVTGTSQLLCSTAALLPLVAYFDQPWTLQPSAGALWALIGVATISSAFATVVYYRLMARVGPANTLLVTLLMPVSAIALGSVVLGEVLLWRHLAGAVVIAVALLVIDGRALGALRRRGEVG